MSSIHQVNHPGREQGISYRGHLRHAEDYYFFPDSKTQGVRLWNRTMVGPRQNMHKRKFMECAGTYVDALSAFQSKNATLRFWGEYEGHSRFKLLEPLAGVPYWENPCALHHPFFCAQGMQDQNTDPWIFGEHWYYAICQKSRLRNIQAGDLILFGSEFGDGFYLDTLFVVQERLPSQWELFAPVYRESTLRHLSVQPQQQGNFPVHVGLKQSDAETLFSFVPAHLPGSMQRNRPRIDTITLGLKKPGARTGALSRTLQAHESIHAIWETIAASVLAQGMVLATYVEPLPELEVMP